MKVDKTSCEPLSANKKQFNQYLHKGDIDKQVVFSRVSFILFSMLISSSFLASMSVTGFYITIVLVLGLNLRTIIIWPSYKAAFYEAVETDAILRLVDYVNIRRYEGDIVGEEEGYRLLREVIHQTEFFKAICGSCLRGTLDPNQDFLSKDEQKKMAKIQVLEKKGFDVKKLKDRILDKAEENLEEKKEEAKLKKNQ